MNSNSALQKVQVLLSPSEIPHKTDYVLNYFLALELIGTSSHILSSCMFKELFFTANNLKY